MRRLTLILLVLMSAFALAKEPSVLLGGAFNLSGSQSGLDQPSYKGAQLAVEQANEAGGVLGRTIELVLIKGDSNVEHTGLRTLVNLRSRPGIAAVMGLSDTDQVLAAAKMCAQEKRLFLTSGATSPQLPEEVPHYLFLACFGDNVQAAVGAEYASLRLGAERAAVVYDDSMEYTRLLQGYFQVRFKQLGGSVVAEDTFEKSDFSKLSLPDGPVDVVYLAVGPQDVLPAVRHLRKAGFQGAIIGGDSYDSDIWKGQTDLNDIYFTTHAYFEEDNPDPVVQKFRQAYLTKFGEAPDAFAGLGYDAMNLLVLAVKNAASDDPAKVLEALSEIQDYDGVTGEISYSNGSRIPQKTVCLMSVKQGRVGFVAEVMPRVVPEP